MIAQDPAANIVLKLSRWAAKTPGAPAVVCGGRSLTFAGLDEESGRLAAGLECLGLAPGERAALMVPPSLEFFALAFALFRLGAVPVFIDPGLGLSGVGRCLEEAAPKAFIGTPKAHLARALGRWRAGSLRIAARGAWPGALPLSRARAGAGAVRAPRLAGSSATAAILFTSGSTGAPKGAVYTHGMFCAQVELLEKMFSPRPGQASVPTFPLFGLFDAALGLTAHVPDMDFTRPGSVDPRRIVGLVEKTSAAQLFGSPALLDVVGRFAQARGLTLPSLGRVLSAGAPVPARTLARWAGIAPNARVHTPYGATEALPVCDIEASEILSETAALSAQGRGTCVGRPVDGVEVRVIEISDEPVAAWDDALSLPAGREGEICVRGPVVSARYDARPRETALAKIPDADGLWHRMGDLGYFDERGRLWFCGRKSQRVQTATGLLLTVPCEGVFNAHPAVRRSALVGVRLAGSTIPVLCVELERGAEPEAVRRELLALAEGRERTRAIKTILFHPSFPVDIRHNAKIFREKLAVWARDRIR